jgi:hypothetical protein
MHRILSQDIEKILSLPVPKHIANKLDSIDESLIYTDLSPVDYEQYLIHVINVLTTPITQSGPHRLQDWEKGWKENLVEFAKTQNTNLLIPKYHGKHRYVRWQGRIVNPVTKYFDYKIHTYIIDTIIDHYVKNINNIYEFGCGPAYHLLRLSSYYNDKQFFGLDWTSTSQEIIQLINEINNTSIIGNRFDFFSPDYNVIIHPNSLVYTIAALEQVGKNFVNFIDYLLKNKPQICIHLEPMSETLNKDSLVDLLSIKYFEKRNYLSGFLEYLSALEKQKRIEIIDVRRTYAGSYFIEGHSLVVWRPLTND